jgi:type II secretion system protein H
MYSMSSRLPTARRAFTLIELTIVVLILAIVAAIVVPMVGNRSDLRLAGAARRITADLQYAQALAISTQVPQYVRFSANRYELMTRAPASNALVASTHPIEKTNFTVDFNSTTTTSELVGVTLDAATFNGTNAIVFDSQGAPSSYNASTGVSTPLGARATLTLRSGSQSLSVYVEAYTGEIAVSN